MSEQLGPGAAEEVDVEVEEVEVSELGTGGTMSLVDVVAGGASLELGGSIVPVRLLVNGLGGSIELVGRGLAEVSVSGGRGIELEDDVGGRLVSGTELLGSIGGGGLPEEVTSGRIVSGSESEGSIGIDGLPEEVTSGRIVPGIELDGLTGTGGLPELLLAGTKRVSGGGAGGNCDVTGNDEAPGGSDCVKLST